MEELSFEIEEYSHIISGIKVILAMEGVPNNVKNWLASIPKDPEELYDIHGLLEEAMEKGYENGLADGDGFY